MNILNLFFSIVLCCGSTIVFSQTNTFPTSGNAGVGTTSPTAKLDVRGVTKTRTLTVTSTALNDGNFLKAGNVVSTNLRMFNWGSSIVSNSVSSSALDFNGMIRQEFIAGSTSTYFDLHDQTESEFFKVSNGDGFGTYIHMPKSDSKIVIGGFASYLYSEGHSLIVKDGTSLLEGDVFTNGSIGIGTDTFVDGSYL